MAEPRSVERSTVESGRHHVSICSGHMPRLYHKCFAVGQMQRHFRNRGAADQFEDNGDIRVTTTDKPIAVKLWQATNPNSRDFRVEWVGPLYKSSVLRPTEPGVYVVHVAKPKKGWTAFFVELIYRGPKKKYPFHFTTAVRVLPDTEPYPSPIPGETKQQCPDRKECISGRETDFLHLRISLEDWS